MDHLSLTDKLLHGSERLFPLAVIGLDMAIWLLVVPGKVLTAI